MENLIEKDEKALEVQEDRLTFATEKGLVTLFDIDFALKNLDKLGA
jgi:hypothetical protein